MTSRSGCRSGHENACADGAVVGSHSVRPGTAVQREGWSEPGLSLPWPLVRGDPRAVSECGGYLARGDRRGATRQGFLVVALFPVVIEDMKVDDIPAVQAVENASFPVPWPANAFRQELTQNKNAHYIVAREGERIVGYAGLWLSLDEAHITTFAVLPQYRRRKIGERMLLSIFERAQKLGAEWLTLEVRASNLAAQKLYEKYGFRRAGVRRRYYSDNNEDAIIMWTERLRDRSVRDRLAKLQAALDA